MKRRAIRNLRVYRYPFWAVALPVCISMGLFITGLFFIGVALVGPVLGRLPSGGQDSPVFEFLIMGVLGIFASGFPLNMYSAIGVNGHMMVRIYWIRWVTIPWEDVQEPILLPPKWIGGQSSWVVPVRRRLTPWHGIFGSMALGHLQPGIWINPSLQEYEKVLEIIEQHLRENDHAEEK